MPWVYEDEIAWPSPSKKEISEVVRYAKMKKTRPRFYADEDFPQRAIDVLRSQGFEVLTAAGAGKRGHPDENHLAEARRRKMVLISCDRDFLSERKHPLISCPALAVFDFGAGTRSEIIRAFRCLTVIIRFPQVYDKWAKLDAKPDEWVEHVRFQDGSTKRERLRYHRARRQVWTS